jgi:hypothetical protein
MSTVPPIARDDSGEDGWVLLEDLARFRTYKRSGKGIIVIRRSHATTAHHPDCPHVREDAFSQRLMGKGGYWWVGSLTAAQQKWPSTRVCNHPSDPLAGGLGGPEAIARQVGLTQRRDRDTWSVDGPRTGLRAVRVSCDRYIPYDRRTPELDELRDELRRRLRRLAVRDGELLHATFFGAAPDNADVENLLLYNVDDTGACFVAARDGVRFERSSVSPPDSTRPVALVYRPAPGAGTFAVWQAAATIADWSFSVARLERLAVWWAARQAAPEHIGQLGYGGPLCVGVTARPPAPHHASLITMVKPLFDGIIGALQTHANPSTLAETAARIAAALNEDPTHVERALGDTARAHLTSTAGPFNLLRSGVQLSPVDERCMAGELRRGDPTGDGTWRLTCRVSVAEAREPRRQRAAPS